VATKQNLKVEAQEKLDSAEAALLAYVQSNRRDPALLELLIRDVDGAIADYAKLVDHD
jgi:hypothetical protein